MRRRVVEWERLGLRQGGGLRGSLRGLAPSVSPPEQRAVLPAPAVRCQAQPIEQDRGGEQRGEEHNHKGKHHDLQGHLQGRWAGRAGARVVVGRGGQGWRRRLGRGCAAEGPAAAP